MWPAAMLVDEYRNHLLEASLKRRLGDDWDLT